jgi:hypothetical protein
LKLHITSFEVFTAAMFQVEVFSIVAPCGVVLGYQHFRGSFCLQFILKMEAALTSEKTASQPRRHQIEITSLSIKSSRAISRVRCPYETDVSRIILVTNLRDLTSDGPRNVGFIQTPDAADSPRRLHGI